MTDISDFVQQSHNFIAAVVKPPQATRRELRLSVLLADGR